jgi:diguanylate cyclase (GGDEF)-like protein/PAS domain S-box-containing protein
MRLLPRSLLNRVFLLYGLTLSALLAGALALFLSGDVDRSIEEASLAANMVVEIGAHAITDSVLVNDQDAIQRTLNAAVTRTAFSGARYIEVGGNVLVARAGTPPREQVPAAIRRWVADQLPEVNRVITAGGRDYGVLRLAFTTDEIAAQLWQTMLRSLALGAVALALGLVLTRWLLGRWLANLDHLGHAAEQIRAGELDVHARPTGDAPEEVRRALEQFNSAASGLRDRYGARIDALTHALVQHKRATDQAVIVLELDPLGVVTAVNDLFCAVSGWPREAVVGRRDAWSLEPERYRDYARAVPQAPCWSGEVACRRRDGSLAWMQRTAVPIHDEAGALEKVICLDIDVTRQKAAEHTLTEEKERAEVTLHSIAEGVATLDADERVQYANPAALKIVGASLETLRARPLREVVQVLSSSAIPLRADAGASALADVRLPDGREVVLELTRAPLRDTAGRRTGEVIAFRDVTQEHQIRRELQRLSLAVEHAASAIFITDPQGRVEYVNPKFTQLTGFALPDVRGQTPRFLKSGQTGRAVYDAMWDSVRAGRVWRGELLNRRKDGSLFWCTQTLSAVCDEQGRPSQYVSVMEDVTQRKRAEEIIHKLAYFDALTELPNRRMFMERAVQQLRAAREVRRPLAMCYLDLDGFKNVNDTLGHGAGDTLLAEVARRIRSCLREGDFLGRLGGDEFALLLQAADTPEAVAAIGRRIIELLEQVVRIDQHDIYVSTSIGVAMCPDDGVDVTDLLRKADMALYRAKEVGKRKLVFFTAEIEQHRRNRSELEAALREALPRREFKLVYQPKVDIDTQAVTGAEALLRWEHPGKGRMAPDLFVPLAEETRLIVPIGRWVLEEACRQIRVWNDRGLEDVRVAVNLSSVQFRSPELVEDIERIVRDSGIRAEQLELEITESGLMEDPAAVAGILERLRAIGLTIAIDDFGTGYSSLAYLKSFPVSVLKIDRSFVRDLERDANDRGIAEAVISMARVLKVDVVAEGVETRGQLDILDAMGCHLAQGYYFSRPILPEAFESYWWRHRPRPHFEPTDAMPPGFESTVPG